MEPNINEIRKGMLQELLDMEDGLTPWEADFVDSLSKQPVANWTKKQIDMLNKIYEDRT